LRTYGRRDEFLILMHSRQRGHRLLVLRVPAGKMSAYIDQRREHARKQVTYQDDERENYSPGMRVQWDFWKPYL
jgi:CelD/BcsL family acetyltransferase involved in cellulose biosynthesis